VTAKKSLVGNEVAVHTAGHSGVDERVGERDEVEVRPAAALPRPHCPTVAVPLLRMTTDAAPVRSAPTAWPTVKTPVRVDHLETRVEGHDEPVSHIGRNLGSVGGLG
jgi:hypothetical protein